MSDSEPKESLGLWVGGIGFPICLLIIAASPIILIGQVLFWLKRGQWFDIQFGLIPSTLGLDPAGVSWIGVRKALLVIYAMPMWLGLFVFGIGLALAVAKVSELVDPKAT